MDAKDIKDAVLIYEVLITEDAKPLGCTSGSAGIECRTHSSARGGTGILSARRAADGPQWFASATGWTGSACTVSCLMSGDSPVQALAKAHRAFCQRVAVLLAEQAEEVPA